MMVAMNYPVCLPSREDHLLTLTHREYWTPPVTGGADDTHEYSVASLVASRAAQRLLFPPLNSNH